MNKISIGIGIIAVAAGGYWVFTQGRAETPVSENTAPESAAVPVENPTAVLRTNLGDITLELFAQDAPNTVENFLQLAESGFYDGVKFHRVIKGFMIQGGDPLSKDDSLRNRWGTGGPGYAFEDEIHANNRNVAGAIAMANAGPNTNGSQFFINTADNHFLDERHTVFGKVISGMETVRAIESAATDESDRPVGDIIIKNIRLP